MRSSREPGLFGGSGGNQLAHDEFQSVGEIAALDLERLVVGAVDVHRLMRVQLTRTRAGFSPLSSALSHITTLRPQLTPSGS